MKRRRKELFEEPVINLTPLIDVVFVILFVFIVVAPMLDSDHVELASHGACAATHTETSSAIVIHVYEDDALTYNFQPISSKELEVRLKIAKRELPHAVPQIFHDKNARFGTYQSIKNALEQAGFSQMDVILKPQ